ncbi:hypothetical protein QUF89_18705 [Peribacillus simplex]|uniref:Uncharacterized protein n=1 Tax=Peribacillus simplex TaxID=1478 RepID=A0AAW7IDF4_9BACI|nr:hypothetical protein [Peribacillus simplex]
MKNIFNIFTKASAIIERMAETGKVPLFLEKDYLRDVLSGSYK